MKTFEFIVKILEAISYVGGLALIVIALYGLRQIKIAKKTLTLSSKRDALRITSDRISDFYGEILNEHERTKITPEQRDIIDSPVFNDNGTINYAKTAKALENTKLTTQDAQKRYKSSVRAAFEKKRATFNKLEAFASNFTSGLGDEKAAFTALGKTYCTVVKPYIKALKLFNLDGYYNNTVTLFTLWDLRFRKQDLEETITELNKRIDASDEDIKQQKANIKHLQDSIDKIQDNEIKSIGVDDES